MSLEIKTFINVRCDSGLPKKVGIFHEPDGKKREVHQPCQTGYFTTIDGVELMTTWEEMNTRGWKVRDGKWLCPDCATLYRPAPAEFPSAAS